ncbi:4Fe-4S dicluster domain-containing protein [Pyxidicoccus sp. MSG2]|uniref:4Fe-4S dicluster domain-containing protein n=1 Tax=Pyxidicoccus sp. MSG2 TaxID=2996790 RepID=UPI00226F4EB5|nr:4Fe-4S dicluster domain-containing protein [Pyxidicoccus sp. MSG2]MCY1022779.1 hypothetical protein [Pyxidicoccus sp. MSG2]
MSAQSGLSRRALLGLFRRPREHVSPAADAHAPVAPAAPEPPAFSLEAFYAGRARTGEATVDGRIPVFSPRLAATVRVRTQHCLAWQGSFCTTCVERCPVEGAIVVEAGRPRVVAANCDGCGTCVRACPAPINAFELLPAGTPGVTP